MADYDVVVVGAGPIGCVAARYAANNGASVLLLEEHASIGTPVGCAGILSTRAVSECDISSKDNSILNSVRGAFVYPPDGNCLTIDGKKTKAHIVSRKLFDKKLGVMAVDAGVELFLKSRVVGIETNNSIQKIHIIRNGVRETISSSVIIGADGVKSNIAKMSGLGTVKKILSGVQFEVLYDSKNTDFVEVYLGSSSPGFFAWSIPINEKISRIGLSISGNNKQNAMQYLDKLLKSNPQMSLKYKGGCFDFIVGGIPLGPLKKTVTDGVMIVGDAAGQVKPTTGGGIYTGAACAKIVGRVAASASLSEDCSKEKLNEYEKEWRKKIGKELSIGMKINEFVYGLEDTKTNAIINSINTPEMLDLITEYGDMDKPSILMKKILFANNSYKMFSIFRNLAKAFI